MVKRAGALPAATAQRNSRPEAVAHTTARKRSSNSMTARAAAGAAAGAAAAQQQQQQPRNPSNSSSTQSGTPNRPPTAYELRVYQLCTCIPRGRVATYGGMAAALDSSARAVGQAMRRNPFAPRVPCHRVVAADLQLGGFSGSWGIECENVQRKKQMLQQEGVTFDGDKVCAASVVGAAELLQLLAANSSNSNSRV